MKSVTTGALINRTDEIRSVLRELMHPDSRVLVCATSAGQDHHSCEARILGPDWQLRHFFWRPHELDVFEAHLRASPALHGVMLDFTATTPDGDDIRFRVSRPLVMHFADSSAAMLSGFPDMIWYQGVSAPADI
ncbi:hypothetical protein [Bordetella sp. BOR01]|uniref:hypothetical protein n=1 Tax=Bordetella sp. BOR01 TaxID=2854779 RepID=UPI001C441BF6|nr:hypothetical protein [Bordetella sp. BOR01]MBV7486315.1 hypothetical protein [Bordetella sp. BOR01]